MWVSFNSYEYLWKYDICFDQYITKMFSKDPLHGKTLEAIINELVVHYGWGDLGKIIPINCFNINPTVKSSLTFLRKTPWARKKVEELYIRMIDSSE